MKFDLVRNQNGQAVVNWPGVIGMSLAVTAIYAVGWLVVSFVLNWYSSGAFLMLPWLLFCVVGLNTRRALQSPPWQGTQSAAVS